MIDFRFFPSWGRGRGRRGPSVEEREGLEHLLCNSLPICATSHTGTKDLNGAGKPGF